jgi:hypothetical protein
MPVGPMYSHEFVGPLIKPGVDGLFLLMTKLLVPLVPQSFVDCTDMLLDVKFDANVTLTKVSFSPRPLG